MKLSQYPRPKGDNGWGIHWSPSTVHPTGEALSPWIDELVRMHIKWVKVLDDGDGSSVELCRRLVRYDIMPIVRIYRPQPNPGRLSRREEEAIRRLVDVGVVYFETNNEPDMPAEWQYERLPPDWISIVVDQFIYDADRVLALGGLPGLPALSVGSKANLVEMVVRKGRADIFARGAWIAVHNYTLNHPLDYPYDPVHQEGAPLTRQEYERHGEWAWDGQPRQLINLWRRQGKRPGSTIEEDSDCWRCFELADLMAREALGYSVPVIGTEGGAVIGWRDDRRYPRVTPEIHKDWTVQINRFLQTQAPAYFFTTCHWLLANFRLGHHVMGWESQAWFSDWWESAFGIRDHLPAVDALRDLPGGERLFITTDAEIVGQAAGPQGQPAHNLPIRLIADGQEVAVAHTNARGRFRFSELPAGRYELRADDNPGIALPVQLDAGARQEVHLTIPHGRQSAVRGQLRTPGGGPCAGVEVRLLAGDEERRTITDTAGAFRFEGLPAGTYTLRAGGGCIQGLYLDGWSIWEGEMIVPPPPQTRFVIAARRLLEREETAGRHIFFGQVWDENGEPLNGVTVEMGWENAAPGTQFPTALTGADPRHGAGYYEFTNTPGTFFLRVRAQDAESETAEALETAEVPGRRGEPISYEVHFQRVKVPAPASHSLIRVELGGVEHPPAVTLRRGEEHAAIEPSRREEGAFIFEGLSAGEYQVLAAGLGEIGRISVDGWNPGFLRFPMGSQVRVRISRRTFAGVLRLESQRWGELRQAHAEPGEEIRFTDLPAGTYHLRFQGWQSPDFVLDGQNSVSFRDVEAQQPFHSELSGRLLNADGEPLVGRRVLLMDADGALRGEQRTDRFGRCRFAGLGPGRYTLVIEELGISQGNIVLDGRQSREIELTAPAVVRPKLLEHYVLLPAKSQPGPWVSVLLLSDFIRRAGAVVGFSLQEAQMARYVTIVADADEIDESAERRLLDAGCVVRRLPGESHALSSALRSTPL